MSSEHIIVIATIRIKPGEIENTLPKLKALVAASQAEEGVITYSLHQSKREANKFVFYEVYANQEAFQAHSKSEHFQSFSQESVQFLADPPIIQTYQRLA